jgi:hypothetical protein
VGGGGCGVRDHAKIRLTKPQVELELGQKTPFIEKQSNNLVVYIGLFVLFLIKKVRN